MIEIAPWLPHGPLAYVAVRAPLPAERGFRWFAEIDGRPDPDELAGATQFVLRFLDGEGDRPVLLLAFRGGVTLAGSLLFAAPERFSGAVLLHGPLPLDPQPPSGALRGIPVLLAHAEDDPRTPQPMLAATRDWLRRWSGAPIRLVQAPGRVALRVGGRRDRELARCPAGPHAGARREPATRRSRAGLAGSRPASGTGRRAARYHRWTPAAAVVVHPDPSLWDRIVGLGIPSDAKIGPPGTRSLLLADAAGPPEAFLHESEFAHVHPDGSLHLCLPPSLAYDALVKGWALAHPLAGVRLSAGLVLVPAPRNAAEREIVTAVVTAARR